MNELAWSPELTVNQRAFLEIYSLCGKVKTAAKDICHRACHYRWLRESVLYKENFEIAKAMRGDEILAKAQDLALEGVEEPIISRGQPVYDKDGKMLTRKRYDRTLLRKLIDLFRDPAERQPQVQKATQRDTFSQRLSDEALAKSGKGFWESLDPRKNPAKPLSAKNFRGIELPMPAPKKP